MDKRSERMLEEILKIPGNERCADCRASAPRWASVNLGIFICVGCASVHRKLGTHKSRVKSVTLDSWSREHLNGMREMGNTSSNRIWNPDERLHPPPTSLEGDDRDGELEKYIRRKYEQGAFKAGNSINHGKSFGVPTSMDRARAVIGPTSTGAGSRRDENGGMVRSSSWNSANMRNPELNDVIIGKEKDLPRLPSISTGGSSVIGGPSQPPRTRPTPISRGGTPQPQLQQQQQNIQGSLIDLGEGSSATLPLQTTGHGASGTGGGYAGMGYSAGGMGSWQAQGQGGSWMNGATTGQPPSFQQQQFLGQDLQPQQQQFAYSSPSPTSFPSNSPFNQPQQPHSQFSSGSYTPQTLFPQIPFQTHAQPQQSQSYQQSSSFLSIPQYQQQQGIQQFQASSLGGMGYFGQNGMSPGGTSPGGVSSGGMGGSSGSGYVGGMGQNGMQWSGGMNVMGTIYGQGMR